MKIKIDIECTPQEARTFFGLPDLEPMQKAMMQGVQERMEKAMAGMDAEALMKTWLPAGIQGFQDMQKMFWSQMTQSGQSNKGGKGGKED
jgi:hypothetical protein